MRVLWCLQRSQHPTTAFNFTPSALPNNFNHMNASPVPPRETCFSIRASRALQRAFAPVTNEALAMYLFSPTPRIPSKSFSRSVVLHVSQKFTHSGLSDPRRAFRAPTVLYSPTTESASLNLVLTPLKREGNTLLGVVSIGGVIPTESILPFPQAFNHGIQRGRFVYDLQNRQMVSVMDGMSNDMLCVVSARWFGDAASPREKFFFGIPKRQYSFDDMPKLAVVVLSNLEYRISKAKADESTARRGIDETDSLFGNFMGERTQTALEVRQTSDAFDMSAMMTAVENLASRLSGLYYGPKLKRDVINISTGELSSRASGKMVVRLSIPDYVDQCKVRRMVAQDYFLQLLPPGSERWFSQNADAQNLGAIGDTEDDDDFIVDNSMVGDGDPLPDFYHLDSVVGNSSQVEVSQQTSVPSRESLLMANMGMANMEAPFSVQQPWTMANRPEQGMTNEELKRRKDEERRKRNRLSAARSNERRRQREKAQMKELEVLKAKRISLEGVQNRLIDENNALRRQAGFLE